MSKLNHKDTGTFGDSTNNTNELSVAEPRSGVVNAASRLSFVENNQSSTLIAVNGAQLSSMPGTVKRKAQLNKLPDGKKDSALALKKMIEEGDTDSKHGS